MCTTQLKDLQPITIKDLKPKTVHKDKILWGKQIVKPISIIGTNLVIEDDNGLAIEMSIYNKFPVTAHLADIDKIFPSGCKIGVKNPYLRLCPDSNLMLRVDNPTQNLIIIYPEDNVPQRKLQTKEKPNVTDYIGPVEVCKLDPKGRALIATAPIKK